MTETNQTPEVTETVETENPWLSIWLHPRKTIRFLTQSEPGTIVLILAIINGINDAAGRAVFKNLGAEMDLGMLIAIIVIGGAIGGVVSLFVLSFFIEKVGSFLGGKASNSDIKTVMAWTTLPSTVPFFLAIPVVLLSGASYFTINGYTGRNPFIPFLELGDGLITIVGVIWSFVLFVAALAELQKFSIPRTLANIFIPTLAILLLVGTLVLISLLLPHGGR